jgi:hypothetical protein
MFYVHFIIFEYEFDLNTVGVGQYLNVLYPVFESAYVRFHLFFPTATVMHHCLLVCSMLKLKILEMVRHKNQKSKIKNRNSKYE